MKTSFDEIFNLAKYDRARYICALTAPRSVRSAVLLLLAFDQEIGKIPKAVSEPMIGRIRLQWWLDEMPKITSGQSTAHPVAQQLGALNLEPQTLINLVEARNFELETTPVTLESLTAYAQSTGGALQTAILDVLAVKHIQAHQAAVDIGTAYVLAGFLYDDEVMAAGIKEQSLRDKIYDLLATARARTLPQTELKPAMPALILARLVDRKLRRGPASNDGPGAVMNVWWAKKTKRY